MSSPQPSPEIGVIPYLSVRDAGRAIEFYTRAFEVTEVYRLSETGGRVAHAELEVAGGRFMLAEEYPEYGSVGPQSLGDTTVSLTLYVAEVEGAVERAQAAGARVDRPAADQFHGHRTAWLTDPFGHKWALQQRIEVVEPAEMQRRFRAMMSEAGES